MTLFLDISPVPPIGGSEALLPLACCGLFVLLAGGAVALALALKKKRS